MAERYDVVVIGGGPGGYVAAIRAAQLGMSAACIEKRAALGGTCLNVGCIPSKALLESSERYTQAQTHLAKHGIHIGPLRLDLAAMMTRKDRVVKGLTDGVAFLFKKNKVTSYVGSGRLMGEGKVAAARANAEEVLLEGRHIILATGSEAVSLPSLPFDGSAIVSSTEALSFERVPKHLIVVGGGYIGLELGSVWSRLGAKVTVLEALPRLLPLSDGEIANLLQRSLAAQGLTFQVETKVIGANAQGGQINVNTQQQGKDVLYRGDKVLVAVGRRPYTTGLGLRELGIVVDERSGRVHVDDDYRTNVAGIHAIGDLIEGPMLAHKAEEDGIACVERLAGMKTSVNYDAVPSVVYTWPEAASVGPTEEQLKAAGRDYRIGKFPFTANARARCMDETEGLIKVLADAHGDRLLAVHVIGPRASELIAECVTTMEFGGSAEDIARICHAHPTLSEAVREAALAVDRRAIHI